MKTVLSVIITLCLCLTADAQSPVPGPLLGGSGGGGTITALTPTVWTPEQFNAKRDCVTDDTSAINQAIAAANVVGGTVKFAAGCYLVSTVPLTGLASAVHLIGEMPSVLTQVSGTVLKTADTTHDFIQLVGSGTGNCTAGSISGASVERLQLFRSSPATASAGIEINKGCYPYVNLVTIIDSYNGVHVHNTNNALIDNTWTIYSTGAAGCCKTGIYIDSTDNGFNGSSYMHQDVTVNSGSGSNIMGFLVQGTCVADTFMWGLESAGVDYGVYVSSTGETQGAYCRGDVHIIGPVHDLVKIVGVTISGLTNAGGFAGAEVRGGFMSLNANNAVGVDIATSGGSNVSGMQIRRIGGTSTIGIRVNTSSDIVVSNNNISMLATALGLTGSVINSVFSGNAFRSTATFPTTTYISLSSTGNNHNAFSGNTMGDTATTGISIASSNNTNKFTGNTCDTTAITTCITDSGTGNIWDPYEVTPTVDATSCTGATLSAGSNSRAGTMTGLPTGACTVKLTFPNQTAAHGWSCSVSDQTTANLFRVSTSNTTSVTFNGTSVASDVLTYSGCSPY